MPSTPAANANGRDATVAPKFTILSQTGVDTLIEAFNLMNTTVLDDEDRDKVLFKTCSEYLKKLIALCNQEYTFKQLDICGSKVVQAGGEFSKFYEFIIELGNKLNQQQVSDLKWVNTQMTTMTKTIIARINLYQGSSRSAKESRQEEGRKFYDKYELLAKIKDVPLDIRNIWQIILDNILSFELKSDSLLYPIFTGLVFFAAIGLSIITSPISWPVIITTCLASFAIYQAVKIPLKLLAAALVNLFVEQPVNWGRPQTEKILARKTQIECDKKILSIELENLIQLHGKEKEIDDLNQQHRNMEKKLEADLAERMSLKKEIDTLKTKKIPTPPPGAQLVGVGGLPHPAVIEGKNTAKNLTPALMPLLPNMITPTSNATTYQALKLYFNKIAAQNANVAQKPQAPAPTRQNTTDSKPKKGKKNKNKTKNNLKADQPQQGRPLIPASDANNKTTFTK